MSGLEQPIIESSQDIIALADHVWIAISVMIIFLMKGGFLLYEAGLVRAKNTINTAQKNLSDTLIATIIFYIFGYNIMFADTVGGWFGWSSAGSEFHEVDHTFFLYQVVFCSMVATVISGALAERIRFESYMISTIFITAFVYPVFGHWAWGNKVVTSNTSFLIEAGFIDFAGGVVVCAMGGWAALAGLLVIGPRIGKYNADGTSNSMPGNNIVLSAFGVMVLWMGALAFNSALGHAGSENVAHIMSNTLLCGAGAGFTSLVVGRYLDGLFRPERCLYGILAGVTSIAAGCHLFSATDTIIVGITSGLLVSSSFYILSRKFQIDDVVCAVPINGICGAWGALLIGVLGDSAYFNGMSRFDQTFVQIQGVGLSFVWGFGVSLLFFYLLNRFFGIRVSEEHEIMGLNKAEHGVTMGTGMLQEALRNIVEGTGDLTQRLDESTGDESAEIAVLFNRFVQRIQFLMINIAQNAKVLSSSSDRLSSISTVFSDNFEEIIRDSDTIKSSSTGVSSEVESASFVASDISKKVDEIAKNANDMSSKIKEVTNTIANMTNSISDVANSSSHASLIVNEANHSMARADEAMQTLVGTSEKIGSIVDFIKNIADETNLLALNASIESARAGEMGRGFAVVAEEIKALAGQTAKATEEIVKQISEVQSNTNNVHEIIANVSKIMTTIDHSVRNISEKASVQSTDTEHMSSSLHTVSNSAQDMAQSISSVAEGAQLVSESMQDASKQTNSMLTSVSAYTDRALENKQNASSVKKTSDDLTAVAEELTEIVAEYKV